MQKLEEAIERHVDSLVMHHSVYEEHFSVTMVSHPTHKKFELPITRRVEPCSFDIVSDGADHEPFYFCKWKHLPLALLTALLEDYGPCRR